MTREDLMMRLIDPNADFGTIAVDYLIGYDTPEEILEKINKLFKRGAKEIKWIKHKGKKILFIPSCTLISGRVLACSVYMLAVYFNSYPDDSRVLVLYDLSSAKYNSEFVKAAPILKETLSRLDIRVAIHGLDQTQEMTVRLAFDDMKKTHFAEDKKSALHWLVSQ